MNKEAEFLLFREIRNARERVEQNPIKRDAIPGYNAMLVGEFVEQTHVAIDKGLKWAIKKSGGNPRPIHSLQALLQDLGNLDNGQIILDYLRECFIAARKFYCIDISRPEFRHIKTFDSYINRVGGKKVYDEARYSTLNAVSEGDFSSGSFSPEALRYVFPQAHIEILRALERLKLYASRQENHSDKDNVIARVEREVFHQIIDSLNDYSAIEGGEILEVFEAWNEDIDCYVDDLEFAVRNNFNDDSCGEMGDVLRIAYTKLLSSKDPAVKYRMDTFRYLEKDSQVPLEGIDLEQCLRQVNKSKDFFEICSPSGEHIGFVERHFDGSWSGDAIAGVRFVAWGKVDAAWLLLRLGVWPCDFVINGVARQHLLIGHGYGAIGFQLSEGIESAEYVAKQDWELKFWDNTHGLKVGDRIAVNAAESAEWQESQGWRREYFIGNIILGDVSEVNGHEVKLVAEGPIATTLPLDKFLSKHAVPDFF